MDINTLIQIIVIIVQAIITIITLISVILIYKTIKINQSLNQKILFDRITKEERELRIKFQKYIDTSQLFKKGAAQKEEYKGVQWLFKKRNI